MLTCSTPFLHTGSSGWTSRAVKYAYARRSMRRNDVLAVPVGQAWLLRLGSEAHSRQADGVHIV